MGDDTVACVVAAPKARRLDLLLDGLMLAVGSGGGGDGDAHMLRVVGTKPMEQ